MHQVWIQAGAALFALFLHGLFNGALYPSALHLFWRRFKKS
jgi:fucose permease